MEANSVGCAQIPGGRAKRWDRFPVMTDQDGEADTPAAPREARPRGQLVFISHDSRDADLAEAFSKLLTRVSAGMLKSFRSSDRKGVQGIAYGVEWYPELMRQLDSACDVVCILTSRSLGRPWILYEAGVAKGKLEIPVHGLALGVPLARVSTGPFAQFQNCDDDPDALSKLIEQLIRRIPHADPDHETVVNQVAQFKATVDEIIANRDDREADNEVASDEASSAKLFEEVKVMFQDLPSRLESITEPRRRRSWRFHPHMVEEMMFMTTRGERDIGTAALILVSPFQEDAPWLYTMAVEVYRASLTNDRNLTRSAFRKLHRAFDTLMHGGPMGRELLSSSRDMEKVTFTLARLFETYSQDFGAPEETDEKLA